MVSFPYYSHTTPIRIPKDMGIVWEAYHKGVPLLGVPENPIEMLLELFVRQNVRYPLFGCIDWKVLGGSSHLVNKYTWNDMGPL